MDELADKVIQANEEAERREQEEAEEQARLEAEEAEAERREWLERNTTRFVLDDLGIYVEEKIHRDKMLYANYIKFRCLLLNNGLYKENGLLYKNRNEIYPDSVSITSLARFPVQVTNNLSVWVYQELLEVVPELDRGKIYVGNGIYWDTQKADLMRLDTKFKIRKEVKKGGRKTFDAGCWIVYASSHVRGYRLNNPVFDDGSSRSDNQGYLYGLSQNPNL